MAPQQVRKLASDWSIYSRDFTHVHPDVKKEIKMATMFYPLSRATIPRLDSVTYFRPGSCGGKISFKFLDKN